MVDLALSLRWISSRQLGTFGCAFRDEVQNILNML